LLCAPVQLAEGLLFLRQVGIRVEAGAARYPYKRIAVELRVGEIVRVLEALSLVQQARGQLRPEPRRVGVELRLLPFDDDDQN